MFDVRTSPWYKCPACGDLAKNPIECCGQMMEEDFFDEEEDLEFEEFLLQESSKIR